MVSQVEVLGVRAYEHYLEFMVYGLGVRGII